MKFILARNRKSFMDYMNENRLDPREYALLGNVYSLAGIERPEVIQIDDNSHFSHEYLDRVREFISRRDGILKYDFPLRYVDRVGSMGYEYTEAEQSFIDAYQAENRMYRVGPLSRCEINYASVADWHSSPSGRIIHHDGTQEDIPREFRHWRGGLGNANMHATTGNAGIEPEKKKYISLDEYIPKIKNILDTIVSTRKE